MDSIDTNGITDATTSAADIRRSVQERYGAAARAVQTESKSSGGCCGVDASAGPLAVREYDPAALSDLPQAALLASLGCGNPTALAELRPGETVLDLGSGGGIDVLLSAKRVGPEGFAFGLDMTDEMLALAEQNRQTSGVSNVRFLKGEIEAIPLPANSVDVIISNCVINLSADKDRVLGEAFRVLKPGGRFAVSDIVVQGRLLPTVKASLDAWTGCVAGALTDQDYRDKLAAAGFVDAEVQVTQQHQLADLLSSSCCGGSGDNGGSGCCGGVSGIDLSQLEAAQAKVGTVVSAFVRGTKPA